VSIEVGAVRRPWKKDMTVMECQFGFLGLGTQ